MAGKQESKVDEMMQRITQGLREGYIYDMRKPEFDHFERAAIIRQFLDEKGWSIRKMGREMGIPKSTIEDWLLYNRMDEEEYKRLIEEEGMTHTEIYRQLREKKSSKKQKIPVKKLDQFIDDTAKEVRKYRKDPDYSGQTLAKIDDLKDELNRLKVKIKQDQKNGDKNGKSNGKKSEKSDK